MFVVNGHQNLFGLMLLYLDNLHRLEYLDLEDLTFDLTRHFSLQQVRSMSNISVGIA